MGHGIRSIIRTTLGVALIAILSVTVVACSNTVEQTEVSTATEEVHVTLREWGIEPAVLRLPADRPVMLVVQNVGSVAHDLSIPALKVKVDVAAGKSVRSTVSAAKAGEYEVICSIPGHKGVGMKGTAVVAAAGAHDGHTTEGGQVHGAEAMTPEEMARMHEQGVKDFPVATRGKGGLPFEPVIAADGAKVFDIAASVIDWETEPGKVITAWAYNGQVPGPEIRVEKGDRVRINLHNELPEPTAIHFHGLLVPNAMDGVPGLNQPSVLPGQSFTYDFVVRNAGSHMYHSHFNAAKQVPMGMLGAFIVRDVNDPKVDIDYTMVLNDGPLGFTLNGKGFPATEPIVAKQGQTVRIRYMNEGLQMHPMHLHGMLQTVVFMDGNLLAQPYEADTVMVAPGQRVDVLVRSTEVGPWAFHCHILNHAEAETGMFGMVTAFIVQ